MEIKLNITDEQVKFLKQFAANHYPGAKDNLGTDRPLHLVQTEYTERVYDDGECGDYIEYANLEDDSGKTYTDPREVVIAYGCYDDPNNVPDYDSAHLHGIDGKIIHDVNDYFETYGITDEIIRYSVIRKYQTVAYFFTRQNAQKYIKEQSRGYANDDEYMHFYDLLLKIGQMVSSE